MLTVLSCIAFEHDPLFVALAVIILTVGAVLTMRLFARVRRTQGDLKYLWLLLSGLIAGGTIWSTHFVAMIAYKSPFILGYDLKLTPSRWLSPLPGRQQDFSSVASPSVRHLSRLGVSSLAPLLRRCISSESRRFRYPAS